MERSPAWTTGRSATRIIRRLARRRTGWIGANGFRFRVSYEALLCISDDPLHGVIKLAGMACEFYWHRVGQHLEIGLRALEKLRLQE